MNLLEILTPECIRAPLVSTTKREAIDELVDVLASANRIQDAKSLKEAVWAREQTRTTGIGQGLAIPHGKSVSMSKIAMAIGKPAAPMEFEAIDGKPVRLIVLLASPPDKTSDHIQALANISRMIMINELRERIYAARDAQEIFEIIRSQQK